MGNAAFRRVLTWPITDQPEFDVAVFSFLLHFVWEFIQLPTYVGMAEMPHWEGTKLCLSATFGDVGFALLAYWITALAARDRDWILDQVGWQIALFIAIGVGLTIGFEYYYTQISGRWIYSDSMPLVPPFETGLSPLLQWLVIPPIVIWFTRPQIGEPTKGDAE